jgi:hypothetical protein
VRTSSWLALEHIEAIFGMQSAGVPGMRKAFYHKKLLFALPSHVFFTWDS